MRPRNSFVPLDGAKQVSRSPVTKVLTKCLMFEGDTQARLLPLLSQGLAGDRLTLPGVDRERTLLRALVIRHPRPRSSERGLTLNARGSTRFRAGA